MSGPIHEIDDRVDRNGSSFHQEDYVWFSEMTQKDPELVWHLIEWQNQGFILTEFIRRYSKVYDRMLDAECPDFIVQEQRDRLFNGLDAQRRWLHGPGAELDWEPLQEMIKELPGTARFYLELGRSKEEVIEALIITSEHEFRLLPRVVAEWAVERAAVEIDE